MPGPAVRTLTIRQTRPMTEPREDEDQPNNLHPGQHDEGGHGGMATREQHLGGVRVRGQERLDGQLGGGEVDGGAERGHRAQEAQDVVAGPDPQRHGDPVRRGAVGAAGEGGQLVVQRAQLRVPGEVRFPVEPVQHVPAPLRQVEDPRREPVGVQAQPQHVGRRREQLLGHAGGQQRDPGVAGHQLPRPVHDHRRVRLVRGQHEVHGAADGGHVGVVQAPASVDRGEAGRQQQVVALAQRHLQLLGQVQHHLPARAGPPGLDEAQVPCRDARVAGQVELAEPAALPPVAQQVADGGTGPDGGHVPDASDGRGGCRLPGR